VRFGLIANLKRPGAAEVICRVVDWIEGKGYDFRISQQVDCLAGKTGKYCDREQLPKQCDFMISMGGDGTLLSTARLVADSGVPILGINLGSLGFLTQVTIEEVELALELIATNKHRVENRMLLETNVHGVSSMPESYALNDVVVDRGDVARLIELDLHVNNEFITTYRADGLIIATPTGSTAYNAAVGGPILNPVMEAIVLAPMAPQSATNCISPAMTSGGKSEA
jgi:NAD+ kinase